MAKKVWWDAESFRRVQSGYMKRGVSLPDWLKKIQSRLDREDRFEDYNYDE